MVDCILRDRGKIIRNQNDIVPILDSLSHNKRIRNFQGVFYLGTIFFQLKSLGLMHITGI
jgi:hypothetical protein